MKHFLVLYLAAISVMNMAAQTKDITILAVNDMHASMERFARFAALVDSVRSVYPDLLLFSAGDNRTGNPVNDMHEEPGYPMVALMNKAGFNLSAIGNHEFDSDIPAFRHVVNRSDFRYVCANMLMPDSMRLHIEPYRFFDVAGVRIGVLGVIQRGMNGFPDTHPDKVKDITFYPSAKAADQYSWLRNQCDVYIMLAHEGYKESVELANNFPDLDLLISGHSHTRIDGGELHNGVLLTQAGSHLQYATLIKVRVTDGTVTGKEAELLDISACSKEDAEVQSMIREFNDNKFLQRVLTQVVQDFNTPEELGCMATDAIRIETGSDIALQNPGGVRIKTYPRGPMTVEQVYRMDPFGNEVISYNLTGEEVIRLIETAYYADYDAPPYVSGIQYEMTVDKQNKVNKLTLKMENGSPFNLQKTYKVVLNSYLDKICQYKKNDKGRSLFRTSADYMIDYLEKQPAIDYQGITRVTLKKK